jgi:chloramphenicol 3-O-phosphotransferase
VKELAPVLGNPAAPPPLCIVVNGPSAVGKSTLVTRIQDESAVPLLRFGVDEFYRTVPGPWAGGTPNARHRAAGFSYQDDVPGPDGTKHRQIVNGPDAVRMLRGMNAAVLGLLDSGNHVIVDGQAYQPDINQEFHESLEKFRDAGRAEVSVLELTTTPDAVLARQSVHSRPAGISLGQLLRGPICPAPDLLLDTAELSAAEVFKQVWSWLTARHPTLSY